MKMKKLFVFAGVAMFALSAFTAPEFANFLDMKKAGEAAQKAREFEKMREIYASWRPKATSTYQKYTCFFGESRALREMKKFDEAMKVTDDYIASNPPSIDKSSALLVKGVIFTAQNKISESIPAFESVLKEKEMHGYVKDQTYSNLIYNYWYTKQFDKCVELANTVISAGNGPVVEHAYMWASMSLFDGKKFAECEKLSKAALDVVVKNKSYRAKIAFNYAKCLLERDEEDEPVKYLQECIKLEPNSWRANEAKKLLQELE